MFQKNTSYTIFPTQNSKELKTMLGNLQIKIIQAVQSQLNNFFSVYQSIDNHIFCKFCYASCLLVCQCGCGFLFKVGFVRQGRGFETGSWFLRDVGLSPHLGI